MDVYNAFLHGDLHEEVYMKLPPGFKSQKPGMFYRLRKSLTFRLNILVYVDDLLISGNDTATISSFKSYLSRCFHMKDLGVLKYFLGIEVARNPTGLFLCQRKYALDIIYEVGLLGAKPSSFPIVQNHQLGKVDGPVLATPESYRRLVGRLIYLVVTRPDLAYAVHILSQFMHQPRQEHWEAALRVVRYLKGSPGQGVLLHSDNDLKLKGWCDSYWDACPLTRRSLTGFIVFLGDSPISWKTKKQHTVSLSSAESENRSMATITCELKWLKTLLSDLGIEHPNAVQLFCDNKSALHIANNPSHSEILVPFEVTSVDEANLEETLGIFAKATLTKVSFALLKVQTPNIVELYKQIKQKLIDMKV
ncbi:hypothetical protein OSB04_018836 [Centaurea solstitialis]|uniref:Reverse transcriptase Ty1/copia-type domain-containing protein n=1 Tax=Centaurea solstitialis TaxID=347529 RepID=A0AA38T8M3_9ASTR|nr:hypothetical protein OSB04_018836 [Centaurea solstitialis]